MGEIIPTNSTTSPLSQSLTLSHTPFTTPRPVSAREDCWSEDATFTLIEAWGQRYLDLNRGNLRQKQWQEVADAVNSLHGHLKKSRRTDVQCKNRIDTLKKKYKIEKSRVLDSNGSYKSPWPFFSPLDHLIGNTMPLKKLAPVNSGLASASVSASPPFAVPLMRTMSSTPVPTPSPGQHAGPGVGVGMLPQKRVAERGNEGAYFKRNYAVVAAAAAREEESEEEVESEEERENKEEEEREEEGDGIRKLAKVIEKFGEVYARVEREKQRQLIELEKQRMQFAKELECQRMQMLVEMQVQLEKIKRSRRDDSHMYS